MMGEPRQTLLANVSGEDDELLSSLLNEAYAAGGEIPAEILVPFLPVDVDALAEVLSERRGSKVSLHTASRGDKVRLVELAQENAKLRYGREHDEDERRARALEDLAKIVGLPAPPHRMECFDNSNLQGQQPVAAMSVFLDGRPARGEYRRYRIKTVVGADDYASMREILVRRLRRGIKEGNLPDLLVVDGGRGQLNVAVAVLQEEGVDVPVIGIVKPRTEHAKGELDATDRLVLPGTKDPIKLRSGHPALRVVQWLRDEVHKHAVGYHRIVRNRESLTSLLEAIPGVGPTRRKALLQHLGSVKAVAEADLDVLAGVPSIGPALAQGIWDALHPADLDAMPLAADVDPEDDERL
jgi:excinuclease ABC subunit C